MRISIIIILSIVFLVGCGKIEVDCKTGIAKIEGGFSDSTTLAQSAALILSHCDKTKKD